MGSRGDKEREVAAAERARAAENRERAADAASAEDRAELEASAFWHEETARLHESLGHGYDREDDEAPLDDLPLGEYD